MASSASARYLLVNRVSRVLPYWLLFILPLFSAATEKGGNTARLRAAPILTIYGVIISLFIGFRYRVGGDWENYLRHLYDARFLRFTEVFTAQDPAYVLLNWIADQTVGDIWLVNLACGIIFATGLISFTRLQPRPALALIVAFPYLVIVVAMGYSRQGVAIGLAMIGLASLIKTESLVRFTLWIALAACFHKSAVMLLPIIALSTSGSRLWTLTWALLATAIMYYLFLIDSVDSLLRNYVEAEYESQGAGIRVAMNALPALLFIIARDRFTLSSFNRRLWTNMSLVALLLVPILIFTPSSTAVDRVALYIIPLQIAVLARTPDLVHVSSRDTNVLVWIIILYSAAVQFVWLNFASNASGWLPYQLFPIL